ncbi:unnamed protein product [Mytilus coruscus]|uniref:Uncharacterized protein n=1 Tax=Mytilus coruscus TaxID=42192 RepID=A0A6J8EAR3_MYTCO|nr:unnamed protein product [Mytilus coruscus]
MNTQFAPFPESQNGNFTQQTLNHPQTNGVQWTRPPIWIRPPPYQAHMGLIMCNNKRLIVAMIQGQKIINQHAKEYTSQIDYFLFEEKIIQQLNPTVKIATRHPTNTSDYTLVTANMALNVKRCTQHPVKIYTRPNWRKCDKNLYKSSVENSLGNTYGQNKIPNNVESRIQKIESVLHKAGMKSIPSYRKLKTLLAKAYGTAILAKHLMKQSPHWKDKTNKNQDAVLENQTLKNKKRRLRQLQRQTHASKKEKFIKEIMQVSEKDSNNIS